MPQPGYQSGVDFADQEEAREYAYRVGVEYRFGCTKEQRPESCQLLGDYLEAVENKKGEAYRVYRENCLTRNHAQSCFKYGSYHLKKTTPDYTHDLDEAEKGIRKGCELGWRRSCFYAGLLAQAGTPRRAAEPARAVSTWAACCEAGEGDCCWSLQSNFLGLGQRIDKRSFDAGPDWKAPSKDAVDAHAAARAAQPPPPIPVDFGQALKWGSLGCDRALHWQCCVNVSMMYRNGEGVEKNLDKAKEFKEKAFDITESVRTGRPINFTG